MTHEYRALLWNLNDGFLSPNVQQKLHENDFTIGVFPEIVAPDGIAVALAQLRSDFPEYTAVLQPHYDADERVDGRVVGLLIRPELLAADIRPVRLAGRNALLAQVVGGVDLLAGHLDDRNNESRNAQAKAGIQLLGPNAMCILDANGAHKNGLWPTLMRQAAPLVRRIPTEMPSREAVGSRRVSRIGSIAHRAVEMADGSTVAQFENVNFTDASKNYAPTKHFGPIGLDIDHVFYRGNVYIVKDAQVLRFDDLSDHSAVTATLAA